MLNSSMNQGWESFERMVIPDDAGSIQRREMRRAFYAGAMVMLEMCSSVGDPSISEDEGFAMLESWRKEGERFVAMMNMGRA